MPFGKRLQITGAPAATQDPEYREQQQEPLGVVHTTAEVSVGMALRKLIKSLESS
jgi:hypothetical protein